MTSKATMGFGLAGVLAGVGILVFLLVSQGDDPMAKEGSSANEAATSPLMTNIQKTKAVVSKLDDSVKEAKKQMLDGLQGKKVQRPDSPLRDELKVQADALKGNPSPFGFELGKATYKAMQAKLGKKAKSHRYSSYKRAFMPGASNPDITEEVALFAANNPQGRYLQLGRLGDTWEILGVEGLSQLYFFFDKQEVLAGVLTFFGGHEFKSRFKMLSNKYPLIEHNITGSMMTRFEGARFEQNDGVILLRGERGFEGASLFYVLKPLLVAHEQAKKVAADASQQRKENAL